VLFNTVRETGDDMIAMVSYLATGDWVTETADRLAATFSAQRDSQLVRNVLVAHNDVAGQYWGRGISVVGGADITIRDNRIAQTTTGAGILVARETSYVTWGVNNVLVTDNSISQVQTTAPAYTPAAWDRGGYRTGHGGIEVHAFVFDDERAYSGLLAALSVQDVRLARNSVTDTGANGVRVGEGTGISSIISGKNASGTTVSRRYSGGSVGRIELTSIGVTRSASGAFAIKNQPSASYNVYCESLTNNGVAATPAACGGARPAVTGSTMTCNP
jgi:hypothetical protein